MCFSLVFGKLGVMWRNVNVWYEARDNIFLAWYIIMHEVYGFSVHIHVRAELLIIYYDDIENEEVFFFYFHSRRFNSRFGFL